MLIKLVSNWLFLNQMRIRLVLILLCLIETSFCQAQIGFQLSPAKLYFSQKGTAEQTARLHVNNTTNTRLVLQATCADWRRDSTGTKVYYRPGLLPTSLCSSIKVTPDVIDLAAGEERDVLVTLAPGQLSNSPSFRNGMLFLTQSNELEVAEQKLQRSLLLKCRWAFICTCYRRETGNQTSPSRIWILSIRASNMW